MMVSTIALLALSGALSSNPGADSPLWLTDYAQARQQSKAAQKPIAVFIGSGAQGYDKLSRDGQLGKDIEQVLTANYVCLYLDMRAAASRQLAVAFEMPNGLGVVISDATGGLQAFRHEGDLEPSTLLAYLNRYADPNRTVRTTESNPPRTSFYPAEPMFQPVPQMAFPSFGGGFGRAGGGC